MISCSYGQVAQNVVVELNWRQTAPAGSEDKLSQSRSIYLGWTGMQSQNKLAPMVDGRGINRSGGRQERDVATVEIDATLARMLGIADGQKVYTSHRVT
jgi:peroxin-1